MFIEVNEVNVNKNNVIVMKKYSTTLNINHIISIRFLENYVLITTNTQGFQYNISNDYIQLFKNLTKDI